MPWMKDRYRDLQALIGRHASERQVSEELESHLAMRIDENIAAGMTPEEARADAAGRFGDVARVEAQANSIERSARHARRRSEWLRDARIDLRRAVRALRRAPVFSVTAFVILALGLGAATTVFMILDTVVLRPLPYERSDRLVTVMHPTPRGNAVDFAPLSSTSYLHFLKHNTSFETIAAYASVQMLAAARGRSERVSAVVTTSQMFTALGIRAHLGKTFTAEDDRLPNPLAVVVVGYDYWQRNLGGAQDAVGTTIELFGGPARIVGVLEPGGRMPAMNADLWFPLGLNPSGPASREAHLYAIGRLKDGVSVERARADLQRLTAQLPELFPSAYSREFMRASGMTTDIRLLRDEILGGVSRSIWLVFALVVLVLLIACTNVANLFLVRADARRRESAVRIALGSGRGRLAWHFMVESLSISVPAGLTALGIGAVAARAVVGMAPASIPRLGEVALRPTDVAFTLAGSLLIGLVLALLQAVRSTGALSTLREGGRSSTISRPQQRVRSGLVVGQVALALVLLAAAGVMIRSIQRLRDVRPGFDSRDVLMAELFITLPSYGFWNEAILAAGSRHQEIVSSVEGLAGVDRASVSFDPPLTTPRCRSIYYQDETAFTDGQRERSLRCVYAGIVSPGYFEALNVPVTGKSPTWEENAGRTAGVVMTRHLAERLWPGENPIGKQLGMRPEGRDGYRVVGIVDAMRAEGLQRPPVEGVYFPLTPPTGESGEAILIHATLLVRVSKGDPLALVPSIRGIVRGIDPMIALSDPRTLEDAVAKSMALVTFVTILLGIAAGMGLLLSAIGLFGVIAYVVTQRRPEIGVRMALGASDRRIVGMITRQAVRLAIAGVVVGLIVAIPVVRAMRSLVYGISPTDPLTLGVVSLVLVVVATIAGYIPARHAARIQPVEALR